MRLSPGTALFTVFLSALTAVGPLSTDMYLPSLPAIALAFNADTGATQLTLSAHLIGFAGSQLFYGPLADRYGRRPVLLGGFVLYIVGCFLALFVGTIEELIVSRFIQAIGGGASVVLARAIVRDLFEGAEAGQMLARMAAIMGLVPAVAPVLGGLVEASWGWQMNFVVMGGFGLLLAIITLTSLGETLPPENRQSAAPSAILRHYRHLLLDRHYLRFLLISCVCFSGLFAFISGSSFVLQDIYGLSPISYGLCFGAMAGGYIAGSLMGGRLVRKRGIEGTLKIGGASAGFGGITMILASLLYPSAAAIVIPVVIFGFGFGMTMPQSMAGALTPFPLIAGTASSLLGFLQSMVAAMTGVYVGHGISTGALPMVGTIALMAFLTFVLTNIPFGSRPTR